MNKAISIVDAVKADLPAIEALLVELVNAMDSAKDFNLEKARKGLCLLLDKPYSHLLVAKLGGATIGFIHFGIRQTAFHPEPAALIDDLVVAKSHRRQGVGRRLMTAAIDRCRQLGCCELEVSTEKDNTEASEFYKRCGLKDIGIIFEMDI